MKKADLLKRIEALEAEVQRLKAYQSVPAPAVSPLPPSVPDWTNPLYRHYGPGRLAPYPQYEVTCIGQH